MIARWAGLLLVLGVLLGPVAAGGAGHYLPQAGDRFTYSETVLLNGGMGNYSGYSEATYVNGTVGVTAVLPNGTDSATYQNSDSWRNSTGAHELWSSSGSFVFSPVTFLYVSGTDNQTGYTNPSVWFFMNNSLPVGGAFFGLDTQFRVLSTDASFAPNGQGSVRTIHAQGTGSYQRNDVYGRFTADYTWDAYFDPSTGFIVGYVYVEHDSDGTNGFTWTDSLGDTSTTFALTPAGSTSTGSVLSGWLPILVAVVAIVVVVGAVVWWVVRSRGRLHPLPRHAAPGNIGFSAPPPPPLVAGAGPPPIHLTPSAQPVPQVVLRETVKVPCRYCGTLIDVTSKTCPSCGAPLT